MALFLGAHRLPLLAGLLLLACGAVLTYKLVAARADAPTQRLPIQLCQPASTPCSTALPGGGRLDFSISPTPIRPLQPLQLRVSLDATTAERVEVDFQGVDMDMGTQHSVLVGAGHDFSGQAMLPICTSGRMAWSATIHLIRPTGTLTVPFHFDVLAR